MGINLPLIDTCLANKIESSIYIESKMDFISNVIIDLMLSNSKKYTKWGLPSFDKSNKLIVKGVVKG